VMRVWENGRAWAVRGLVKSSTVPLIAVTISSRDVYGKQILSIELMAVSLAKIDKGAGSLCVIFGHVYSLVNGF